MMTRDEAEELRSITPNIGTQVIQGSVRYRDAAGGLNVGDVDIEELLHELKDQEVLVIVAPLRPAQELPAICGLCGMSHKGEECPACQAEREEAKRVVEERLLFDKEFPALLS